MQETVWIRISYEMEAREPKRSMQSFNVSEVIPVAIPRMSQAAKTAFKITNAETGMPSVYPVTTEYILDGETLMRPVLGNVLLAPATIEELAKRGGHLPDHPFHWTPYSPNTQPDRAEMNFKEIASDGRDAAIERAQKESLQLRLLDSVIYRPAPPPLWSLTFDRKGPLARPTLPEHATHGRFLLPPLADLSALAPRIMGKNGERLRIEGSISAECFVPGVVEMAERETVRNIVDRLLWEFNTIPFMSFCTPSCMLLAKARVLYDGLDKADPDESIAVLAALEAESKPWLIDETDVSPQAGFRDRIARHLSGAGAYRDFVATDRIAEEEVGTAFSL